MVGGRRKRGRSRHATLIPDNPPPALVTNQAEGLLKPAASGIRDPEYTSMPSTPWRD